MAEVSGATSTRETEIGLDGWCKGGLGQQRSDGGGSSTMRAKDRKAWRALVHV